MKSICKTTIICLIIQVFFITDGQSINATAGNQNYKYMVDGIERSFILHIPLNLPKNAPLVFILHGYGGSANPAKYGMDEVADKNGFAVCYPQGAKDGKGKTCWNVGYPFQEDMKIDDVHFLCKLAKHLQKTFHLSEKNTFCTGMSNGGEMCYLLAYKKPNVFSAVAPIAGLTMEWIYRTYECHHPIPLFEVHGTKDRVSEWTGDLKNAGGWGAYLPVPIAIQYWVAKNRCTDEQVDTLSIKNKENGHYVISHKYVNGINGNEVWLYQIVNGGHSWGNHDIDTSEEIWKFFKKFIR